MSRMVLSAAAAVAATGATTDAATARVTRSIRRSRVTAGMVSQAVEGGAPIGPKSYRRPGPQRAFDRNIARRFLLPHAPFFSVQTGRSSPYEMIRIQAGGTPPEAREFQVLFGRPSPTGRVYSA